MNLSGSHLRHNVISYLSPWSAEGIFRTFVFTADLLSNEEFIALAFKISKASFSPCVSTMTASILLWHFSTIIFSVMSLVSGTMKEVTPFSLSAAKFPKLYSGQPTQACLEEPCGQRENQNVSCLAALSIVAGKAD